MDDGITVERGIPLPADATPPEESTAVVAEILPAERQRYGFTQEDAKKGAEARREKRRAKLWKLSDRFLDDLGQAWAERGVQALEALAIHAPDKFVAVVAQLVGKQEEVTDGNTTYLANESGGLHDISERTRILLARIAEGNPAGSGPQ